MPCFFIKGSLEISSWCGRINAVAKEKCSQVEHLHLARLKPNLHLMTTHDEKENFCPQLLVPKLNGSCPTTKTMKKEKSAAILTVKDISKMTPKGLEEVLNWLRGQIKTIKKYHKKLGFASRYTARYLYK